jgi:poly(3-hydroxybutyrate) depolymerase
MHITRYTGGANGTEVEVIRGDHLGNGWPGSTYPDPSMIDAQGKQISATDTVIDFFNHHAKQQ